MSDSCPPTYFSIVCAQGPYGEFGYNNQLPWPKISEDLQHFAKLTLDPGNQPDLPNIVIYGRHTLESFGHAPLTKRLNIVVSTRLSKANEEFGVNLPYLTALSLSDALLQAGRLVRQAKARRVFLIGGSGLIHEGLKHPHFEYLYLTRIEPTQAIGAFQADVFLHPLPAYLKRISSRSRLTGDEAFQLTFSTFMNTRPRHQEQAYLELCQRVLSQGNSTPDRTQTGTLTSWGEKLEFDMSTGAFPLYTTKRVFWKGVVLELLELFLKGKTQTKVLEAKGVGIWKGNTSRAFLDQLGFTDYEEGEMGPNYGFQWRHFGAKYIPNKQLELGQEGFDQIAWVIEAIKAVKANPGDGRARRLLVSAWNPPDLYKMTLYPCHFAFQFQVSKDYLNCLVSCRSNDLFLGNPFNVASYALLTHMIGHLVDLTPGKLVFSLGDAHVYNTHREQLREQLTRPPRGWPRLEIIGNPATIDDFTLENFHLVDYSPHPSIKAPMAI